MIKRSCPSIFQSHFTSPIFAFIFLIIFTVACNFPSTIRQSDEENSPIKQEFTDKNARTIRMYFDSSADPAQNVLQVRRFVGHLHLADIEDIFGDIESLPLDDNCNYVGGPVLHEGLIWYVTLTADLVGVNLISVSPDGGMSSAFDLDGDREADIVDILLADNRRISFVAENNGMDVFASWLRGQNPFCNTELIRQLDLPNLGCGETGDGSSGGGVDSGWGGIVNPMDMLCSEYDTSPMAGIMTGATRGQITGSGPRRLSILEPESYWNEDDPSKYRYVETYVTRDLNTGTIIAIEKIITDMDTSTNPPHVDRVQTERVTSDGHGARTIQFYLPDGSPAAQYHVPFDVHPEDVGKENYDQETSNPPPVTDHYPSTGGSKTYPGPEGDDSNIAEFCQRRANYQSGVEQAANEDPSSMSVSCRDLVADPDMPDDPNCMIIAWARPEEILGALQSSGDNAGCDPLNTPDGAHCEPTDWRERIRGLTAEFRSLQLEGIDICPQIVCNPGDTVENIVYIKGDFNAACPVISGTGTLEPSYENCPPGTFYDEAANSCIAIQIPPGGGNEGGGGCNLSVAICSAKGLSFDSNKCQCVPIQ